MKKIGILGASGSVGRWALHSLLQRKKYHFKIGVRNAQLLKAELQPICPNLYYEHVEAQDVKSIAQFARGMDAIVNCIGPSSRYSREIMEICLPVTDRYVDAGYSKDMDQITVENSKIYLHAAGSSPGLSGLLCRYLAQCYTSVTHMRYINAMSGVFTYNAAWDYLAGISIGSGLSERQNKYSQIKREGLTDITLPFIHYPMTLSPYFDQEMQFVVDKVNPEKADFYIAMRSGYLRRAVERASILFPSQPDQAVKELVSASKIEGIDGREFSLYLVEISGTLTNGTENTKTLVLKTLNPSALTGYVAGITADLVVDSHHWGNYSLSAFNDYKKILIQLQKAEILTHFDIYDANIEQMSFLEEGEI